MRWFPTLPLQILPVNAGEPVRNMGRQERANLSPSDSFVFAKFAIGSKTGNFETSNQEIVR